MTKSKCQKITIVLLVIFLLPGFGIFAQELDCRTVQECQSLLEKLEQRISEYEKDITRTEQEKKSLENQIYLLRNRIKKLDLQIYQSNVMIKDLGFQIGDTEASIDNTLLKIEDSRKTLSQILRTIYEKDQTSLLEILLAEEELSDFFDDLMALETLTLKNQELLSQIKDLKTSLESQKQSLDKEKGQLESTVKMQSLQKQEYAKTKGEQEYFLKLTEAEYQKYLQEKEEIEREAARIRSRIFELIGVPKAPTFGQAYEVAKYVEGLTGVRPALLLAVMSQESNIGKNVGQCYLKNPSTGEGEVVYNGQNVSRVMNPSRDIPHFLKITKELGRDPYNTPVSCPMSFGWGGAMGPAQFIPSTWMLYKDRVSSITGKPADPWSIRDAFLAAGLYLADYGAANKTYNSEWRAAMIYFSGTTNPSFRFYGDSVMALASRYQKDIEALEKAG